MAEINVLDSSIFNRIAAGEVVESPKSIVKELVENSIDAGADKITVQIEKGGINLIRVIDNGKGISSEDLPLAFLPHATSKIKNIQDLDSICTLGFRGEALPSIASVAKIRMTSRRVIDEIGYSIEFQNGKMTDCGEMGCQQGTTITVEGIFKNIPAREKFLKKPAQEESDVSDLIMRFILANPKLSIKYVTDNETKYHSAGDGIESAIFSIYGAETLGNLTKICNSMPHITLKGYISKPSFSKHSRNYQTLIVNGRYVINQDLSFCIQQCYQEYLMTRQFPMYIIYLNLPLDMVDVNIQPNKMNVKFVDFAKIKSTVYGTIKQALNKEAEIPKNITTFMENFSPAQSIKLEPAKTINVSSSIDNNKNDTVKETKLFKSDDVESLFSNKPNFSAFTTKHVDNEIKFNTINEPIKSLDTKDTKSLVSNSRTMVVNESFYSQEEYKIVGKLFNTYIAVEQKNEMFFIDQHAAHEKLIYDKLVRAADKGNVVSQSLLLPYVFEVSHSEKIILTDMLPILTEIGFTIGALSGLYFSISAIPAELIDLNLKEFVYDLICNLTIKDIRKSSTFLKNNLMQSACKAAVKGEEDLSKNEVATLLQEMKNSNAALFCPHGRPIVVNLPKTEIEKWFKRIV